MTHRSSLRLSILLNICLIGGLGYSVWFKPATPTTPQVAGPRTPVIILTPATHPSLEAIEGGFRKTLEALDPAYEIITFNANGNKTLMRSQAEEAINQQPAAIMTIGAGETLLCRELLQKKGVSIPLMFAAVSDPAALGLKPDEQFNGTVEQANYEQSMEVLPFLIPNLKKMLLVYDPQQGTGFAPDRAQLEQLCSAKGIALTSLEVFSTSEIYAKTANVIAGHDAVVIFKDNTAAAGIDALVKLCNQHAIPLVTHHLDAFEQGASISFGANEADYGTHAARLIHDVISSKVLYLNTFDAITRQLIRVAPKRNLKLPDALAIIIENVIQ